MRFPMEEELQRYREYLIEEEKSPATVDLYLTSIAQLSDWAGTQELSKSILIQYKDELRQQYRPNSVNTKITAINGFMKFLGREDLIVKHLRIQKKAFLSPDEELTREEYCQIIERLLEEGDERMALSLQMLCSTGMRVGELAFITCEAVESGETNIVLKGKVRKILIPDALRKKLLIYMHKNEITEGVVFRNCSGGALDRSYIWKRMKETARDVGINPKKVYPHNLRHLFARTFYTEEKDLSKLADILGHSNVNTTRIYTACSSSEHMKIMDRLNLVV